MTGVYAAINTRYMSFYCQWKRFFPPHSTSPSPFLCMLNGLKLVWVCDYLWLSVCRHIFPVTLGVCLSAAIFFFFFFITTVAAKTNAKEDMPFANGCPLDFPRRILFVERSTFPAIIYATRTMQRFMETFPVHILRGLVCCSKKPEISVHSTLRSAETMSSTGTYRDWNLIKAKVSVWCMRMNMNKCLYLAVSEADEQKAHCFCVFESGKDFSVWKY